MLFRVEIVQKSHHGRVKSEDVLYVQGLPKRNKLSFVKKLFENPINGCRGINEQDDLIN